MKNTTSQSRTSDLVTEWLLEMDKIPFLDDETRYRFHRDVLLRMNEYPPELASTWMIYIGKCTEQDLDYIAAHIGNHYLRCVVDSDSLYGYLLLEKEMYKWSLYGILGRFTIIHPTTGILYCDMYDYIGTLKGTKLSFGNEQLKDEVIAVGKDRLLLKHRNWYTDQITGRDA